MILLGIDTGNIISSSMPSTECTQHISLLMKASFSKEEKQERKFALETVSMFLWLVSKWCTRQLKAWAYSGIVLTRDKYKIQPDAKWATISTPKNLWLTDQSTSFPWTTPAGITKISPWWICITFSFQILWSTSQMYVLKIWTIGKME